MKVVLASSNAGKIKELQHSLTGLSIELVSQKDFGVDDAEETGLTFIENALLKARHASQKTGLPALADDSGLVVPGLNGQPGIYSARFSGPNATSQENIQKLLMELSTKSEKEREAFFYCALVFLLHGQDPMPLIAEGIWHGRILLEPRGNHGFGYDPVFYVPTEKKSAAELSSELKNKISHRGMALQTLINKLPFKINDTDL